MSPCWPSAAAPTTGASHYFAVDRAGVFQLLGSRGLAGLNRQKSDCDHTASVRVSVVDVREVGVLVAHCRMGVPVRVWRLAVPGEVVPVLVLRIMRMVVRMGQRLMRVLVVMILGQV